jgi:hypothetical protein
MKKSIFLVLFVISSLLTGYAEFQEDVKECSGVNAVQYEEICTLSNVDFQKLLEQKIYHDAALDAKGDAFILEKTQEGALTDLCSDDAKQVLIFQIAKMDAWHADNWAKVREFIVGIHSIVVTRAEDHPLSVEFNKAKAHFEMMNQVKNACMNFIQNPEFPFAKYCKNPDIMKMVFKMTLLWEEEKAAAWQVQGVLEKLLFSEYEIREMEAKAAAELRASGVEPQYEWHSEQL